MRFCGETAEGRKRGADRRRSLMARRRVIFIRARILALGADLPRVGGEGVNDGFSENRVPPKKSAVSCGGVQRNEARQQDAAVTDTLELEADSFFFPPSFHYAQPTPPPDTHLSYSTPARPSQ